VIYLAELQVCVTTCFQTVRIYAQNAHNGLDVLPQLIAALTLNWSISQHLFMD